MQHNIIITGVGGQGVVTLGLLLSSTAISCGERAIMSEIHGLAQRGGSVSVDVRIGNYHAPIIPDGMADLIVALEPLEALRAISRAGPLTAVVMGEESLPPVSLGIHRKEYPDVDEISRIISERYRFYRIDALKIAREAGDPRAVNTTIAGYIVGLGLVSMPAPKFLEEIERSFSQKYININKKAFELGLDNAVLVKEQSAKRVNLQAGLS